MKLYLSKTHSDDDDDSQIESGKLAMIYGSRTEILSLCKFFKSVEQYLNEHENCHMHLRDFLNDWEKENDIDIEVNT